MAAPRFPQLRPPSLFRAVARFGDFLVRGHSPRIAQWLAMRDAPRRTDARSVSVETLNAAYSCDPIWNDLVFERAQVQSRRAGFVLSAGPSFTFAGYDVWCEMADRGWRFEPRANALIARREGLELHLTTAEEIDMAREIFIDGCYDLTLPSRCHVVDVGGNVGFAALRFASMAGVERVVSFEPFAPTANAFRQQIARNPSLASRIKLEEVGLGASDQVLEVDYTPDLRGSMSVHGLGAWRSANAQGAQRIPIRIARASAKLADAIAAAKSAGAGLVAKIDCEGAEYEIIADLAGANLLRCFDALCIEWHARGPEELVAHLHHHGFATKIQSFGAKTADLGLIHAFRIASVTLPHPTP